MRRGATFSPCGTYRYRLTRRWRPGGRIVTWVMLNPSTADGRRDDPTIRRVIAFSRAWGFDALVVVNLFALRSPTPAALVGAADPVGPRNPRHVERAVHAATTVVAAWGAHALGRAAATPLRARFRDAVCLGMTKEGSPRHPLYVHGDEGLVPFVTASRASTRTGRRGGATSARGRETGNLPRVRLSEAGRGTGPRDGRR